MFLRFFFSVDHGSVVGLCINLCQLKTKLRSDIKMDMTLTVHVRYNLAFVLECEHYEKSTGCVGFNPSCIAN